MYRRGRAHTALWGGEIPAAQRQETTKSGAGLHVATYNVGGRAGPYSRAGVQRESLLRLVALWAGEGLVGEGRGLPLVFGSISGSRAAG